MQRRTIQAVVLKAKIVGGFAIVAERLQDRK